MQNIEKVRIHIPFGELDTDEVELLDIWDGDYYLCLGLTNLEEDMVIVNDSGRIMEVPVSWADLEHTLQKRRNL